MPYIEKNVNNCRKTEIDRGRKFCTQKHTLERKIEIINFDDVLDT